MKLPNLSTIRFWLLAAVLFGGPMALHPSAPIPVFDFPSLRVGLYQIVIALFIASCLPLTPKLWGIIKKPKSLILILPLALSLAFGLITTLVFERTTLYTLAFASLLLIATLAGISFKALTDTQRKRLFTIGLWSGIVFGAVALLQLIIASVDPTAFGTLCKGCSANVFGFPRINGLAAEPQFMASALLPALFAGFIYRNNPRLASLSVFATSLAIFLTFSRGAIYAIILATAVILIASRFKEVSIRPLLKPLKIAAIGMLAGCILLVGSAAIRHSDTPYIIQNTKFSMVEQLSLGLISIPHKTPTPPAISDPQPANETFIPEGYVEASSEERLGAADIALEAWSSSPQTVLFGTGLGNLGSFIQEKLPYHVPTDQTVYIFYVLLLSNIGIIGLIPLLALAVVILKRGYGRLRTPLGQFALLLTIAMLAQFLFFGSLINTVHCFAWLGIFLYNLPHKP